jgi:phosphinothricin acetyltransferase
MGRDYIRRATVQNARLMSPPKIRAASAADAEPCAAIYAPYVEAGATSFEQVPPDEAEMAARIEGSSATHAWLVAERDGEVVGFSYAGTHRGRPAYRWSVEVSVYVSPAHRGEGVGTALYEALFGRLRERRFRVACAGITLPNGASVALHERLGFVPVGVYRGIGWKQGAWRDVGWWQLDLEPPGAGPPPEPL